MTHTPHTPASGTRPARYQQIDQGQLDAWRRKGARNIGFGLLWLVAGLLITLITMSTSGGRHGFYIIAFGPIIGGAIQIISGYRTHQRGTTTPPSSTLTGVGTAAPATGPATVGGSTRSTANGAAPRSPSAADVAWHPVRSITRGLGRDELLRRLGEPSSRVAASGAAGDATGSQVWLYQDTPPGQDTEIILDDHHLVDTVTTGPRHDPPPDSAPQPAPATPPHSASAGPDAPAPNAARPPERPDATPPGTTSTRPAATVPASTTPAPSSAVAATAAPAAPVAPATAVPSAVAATEAPPVVFEQSLVEAPRTPRLLRRAAVRAEAGEDLATARELHQQVIDAAHPGVSPLSMLDLARLTYRRNDVDAARELYQRAIDSGHDDAAPRAMAQLGELLQQLQAGGTGAEVLFTQAIDSGHPDASPRARHELALIYKRRGQRSLARQYLEQVVVSGHDDVAPLAMNNLGLLHETDGDPAAAEALYRQAAASGHPQQAGRGHANLTRLSSTPKPAVAASRATASPAMSPPVSSSATRVEDPSPNPQRPSAPAAPERGPGRGRKAAGLERENTRKPHLKFNDPAKGQRAVEDQYLREAMLARADMLDYIGRPFSHGPTRDGGYVILFD